MTEHERAGWHPTARSFYPRAREQATMMSLASRRISPPCGVKHERLEFLSFPRHED